MKYVELLKGLGQTNDDSRLIREICKEIKEIEPKKAKGIYDHLIDYTKEKNLTDIYPLVLQKSSWVYYDLGEYNTAIEINLQAMKLFEENNNIDDMVDCISLLVGLYSNTQSFAKAREYIEIGLKLSEETGNYRKVYDMKSYLAVIYLELEEYNEASYLFKQVLKLPYIGEKGSNISLIANLSECELECYRYDEAMKYAKEALDIAIECNKSVLAYIYMIIARIYVAIEEYQLADNEFKKAVDLAKEGEYTVFYNDSMVYWASLDMKLGRYSEAIAKLSRLEQGKENFSALRNERIMYKSLSEVYELINNYEKAYFYMKIINRLENDFYKIKVESIKSIKGTVEKEENKIYKILQDETENLYRIGQQITSSLNRANIFNIIESEMKSLFEYDIIQISLVNEEQLEYQLWVERGERIEISPTSLSSEGLSVYAFKNKQYILINNICDEYSKYTDNYEMLVNESINGQASTVENFTLSMLFVPIVVSDEAIGILSIQSYKKDNYNLKDLNKLKILSTYLGIALENSRYYRELQYVANYDVLTKVLNRRRALTKLEGVYDNIIKEKHSSKVNSYILMIDVDNFKKINDTYGHQVGDKTLELVANTIKSSLKKEEFVGRYGGEEFIVVINRSSDEYLKIAEKIRSDIEDLSIKVDSDINTKNIKSYKTLIDITASIGIARIDKKYKTINEVIYEADKCLYKAKNTGKNKVIWTTL